MFKRNILAVYLSKELDPTKLMDITSFGNEFYWKVLHSAGALTIKVTFEQQHSVLDEK